MAGKHTIINIDLRFLKEEWDNIAFQLLEAQTNGHEIHIVPTPPNVSEDSLRKIMWARIITHNEINRQKIDASRLDYTKLSDLHHLGLE